MKKVYSIYDKVAGQFNPPIVSDNDAVAKRLFLNAVKDNPFREDLSLYRLGGFEDSTTGVLVPEEKPVFLCNFEA